MTGHLVLKNNYPTLFSFQTSGRGALLQSAGQVG